MPKEIREAGPLGTVRETKAGRIQVGLITPGWGSSGYYAQQVLENAAAAKVFPAGTQMFLDHPGEAERFDRPERSVRDIAAVLTTDAVWDEAAGALVGEAQVFGPFVDTLTDEHFARAIGVSIRAYADHTVGEAEGRKGTIVTELTEAISVDFVTRAGRGGSIMAVLESARPAQVLERAIAQGVAEASANDTRDALMDALKGAYGGDKTWVWVRDFNETTVWFDIETPDGQAVYQQGYTLADDGAASLEDGDPTEVRARTEYVPVTTAAESGPRSVPAPAGQSNHPQESEEDTMPQIEEGRLAQLEADAGRVTTLESERDTAARERDEAREALAAERRITAAGRIIDAADVTFTALERRGLLTELPVTESGELDEAAFTTSVAEAAAEAAEASGEGRVRDFGRTDTTQTEATESDSRKAIDAAFGRTTTSQEG